MTGGSGAASSWPHSQERRRRLRCVALALINNGTCTARSTVRVAPNGTGGCGSDKPKPGGEEEDPRLTRRAVLRAEGESDPQDTRTDIVLPGGKTRPEIPVRHGWQLSLELNYEREVISGSEAQLAAAIAGGADLRVATNFPHSEHIDPTSRFGDLIGEVATFPVTYLLRPGGADAEPWVAGVMVTRQPIDCPDGFGPRSSLSLFLYNQDGHQAIARPHLDSVPPEGGQSGPESVEDLLDGRSVDEFGGADFDPVGSGRVVYLDAFDSKSNSPSHNFIWHFDFFKFFTGGYWQEVYAHDAEGSSLSGSLDALAAAAGQGCDVKVAVGGLCADLICLPEVAMKHEVMVSIHSNYYYDGAQASDLPARLPAGPCFTAATNPVVRIAPTIPMQYSSGNWDYGWLYCRTDGHVAFRRLDPYTMLFDDRELYCSMRWFVR